MERSTRACEPLILAFSPAAKIATEAKEFSLALQAQRSRERERVRVTNTWSGKNPGWQKSIRPYPASGAINQRLRCPSSCPSPRLR
jgi:hypothetical protein